jgi:hypothetical protein
MKKIALSIPLLIASLAAISGTARAQEYTNEIVEVRTATTPLVGFIAVKAAAVMGPTLISGRTLARSVRTTCLTTFGTRTLTQTWTTPKAAA